MRIIETLPHPKLKISIFEWEEKWIVKVERDQLEQLYKFRKSGPFETWPALRDKLGDAFFAEADRLLESMLQLRKRCYDSPEGRSGSPWPTII